MKRLRFGFIATGNIAQRLAKSMQTSTACELVAAASRSEEKARAFAEEFGCASITGYDALLEREDVEAVYVATPHPQHHEWVLKSIAAGKHILCEKPFTMTSAEAREIAEAAKTHGVLVMEAFMYRFHPQTRKLVELVSSGAIGEIHWVQANFGFSTPFDVESRLFANALGGGGILDVGCYAVSMARMIAGVAQGVPFLDPISVKAVGRVNESEGTDWLAGALLDFPGNMIATVRCGTRFDVGREVCVEGTKGTITLNQPWFAGSKGATIRIQTGEEETILETEDAVDLYVPMLEQFAACAANPGAPSPIMSLEDSLGNMQVLEEWYRQVGVIYPAAIQSPS